MNIIQNEKPRLVPCSSSQGFSALNTIEYKNRLLYSKYNPLRTICELIEKTPILSGSIILILSPGLWYGLDILKKKCKDCAYIALEADRQLYELSSAYPHDSTDIDFYCLDNSENFDKKIRTLIASGKYRRIIPIEFSAGTGLYRQEYSQTVQCASEITERFWKNHITLTKFGRLYSKNIFRNLSYVKNNSFISSYYNSVNKPILVTGAGESLDFLFKTDKNGDCINKSWLQKNFYIIAVDASLKALISRGIIPDAVVLVEAQFAIKQAFLGLDFSQTLLIKDLCSRPDIIKESNTAFFLSKFTENNFTDQISSLTEQSVILPMGSVGLTAVEIAKRFASNESIPIILNGLDFSYSIGRTHAKGTPASINQLISLKRFADCGCYTAAFGNGCRNAGKNIVTSEIMMMYARYLSSMYKNRVNIYNCTENGLDLGFPNISANEIKNISSSYSLSTFIKKTNVNDCIEVKNFIVKEKQALEQAKDLLINGENSIFRNDEQLEKQIENLLADREYLFLHFPDGFIYKNDISFLKRIRAEIDFFLKQINWSAARLQ